jgi:tetratricopeptide (TPR) repeat protein
LILTHTQDWLQLRKSIKLRQEMSFNAISMTASLIRDTDSENLPLSARQELLGHVDSCVENAHQFLKTPESKTAHGGLKEGFQTALASFYSRQDRHADAEKLFTEALVYQQRELGNFHIETMCTMNELGALYLKMGDVENAKFMLTESLQAKERVLGPDHPRTLNTVNNIGNLYSLQLQLGKATEMYQCALEGYTKLYGPKDKLVAEAWNNLGEISMMQGRFPVARERLTTALETVDVYAGGDMAFTLYLKSNLALLLKFEKSPTLAKDLYFEVIEGRSAMLGMGHSSTLQSMCEMGDVLLAEGNKQGAEVWYAMGKASVERRRKAERELEAGEKAMDLDPYPLPQQTSRADEDHIISNTPFLVDRVGHCMTQCGRPFGRSFGRSWGSFTQAQPLIQSPAYGFPAPPHGSFNLLDSHPGPGYGSNASQRRAGRWRRNAKRGGR